MQPTKKRFSDFAKGKQPLDGPKVPIDDILNREILILDFKITESKYGKTPHCMTLQFIVDEEKHILFTGSTVLTEQIREYKDELPFHATIKKIDKFYTFT